MFELKPNMRVLKLIDEFPFLLDFLADYHPKFGMLRNKTARLTFARFATLEKIAKLGELDLSKLIRDVAEQIEQKGNTKVKFEVETDIAEEEQKKAKLKEMLKRLHAGEDLERLKVEFADFLQDVDADEIVQLEDQLIEEGIDSGEIQRLCDVHIDLFKDSLKDQVEELNVPEGHPVHNYIEENKIIIEIANKLSIMLRELDEQKFNSMKDALGKELDKLAEVDRHYVRKENQLFPYLEKHGVYGPPQVMWGVHDDIRKELKRAKEALELDNFDQFKQSATKAAKDIVEMVFKEHSVLFPLAMSTLDEEEWRQIRKGDDEIGYIYINPATMDKSDTSDETHETHKAGDEIKFSTGALSPEQIELIFSNLPVDISFVDENDVVRFYNQQKDRFFPRTPGVIGRKVQNCHPPKSVHIVEKILQAFKSGEKDVAEFWIEIKGRFLHIRYFAVRDSDGNYKGTLEMMQDVTDIRNLQGERRLLDWN